MAKRFTDTDKWKKEWFRKLPVKMKSAWEYLRDNCDHAGIWEGDFGLFSYQLGEEITEEECVSTFGPERFIVLSEGKYYLPSFVEFQYGELTPNNNTHRSVLNRLKKVGALEPLGSPSRGDQDKDKDKDKDKEERAPRRKKAGIRLAYSPEFETLWAQYGREGDKADAFEALKSLTLSPAEHQDLARAISAYLADCRKRERHVKHFSTFLRSDWREWVNKGDVIKPLDLGAL